MNVLKQMMANSKHSAHRTTRRTAAALCALISLHYCNAVAQNSATPFGQVSASVASNGASGDADVKLSMFEDPDWRNDYYKNKLGHFSAEDSPYEDPHFGR